MKLCIILEKFWRLIRKLIMGTYKEQNNLGDNSIYMYF